MSTTKTHEHEDNHEQHQHGKEPFTMQELDDAINQLERNKAADTRGERRDDHVLHQKSQKHWLRLYNMVVKPSEAPLPNWRGFNEESLKKWRPVIPIERATHLPNPSSSTKSSATSSSDVFNPRQTPTNQLTKQASDQATPRLTTCTHSSNSGRKPPSGTRHFGPQQTTSSRQWTWNNSSSIRRSLREKSVEEPYMQMLATL